MTMASEGGGTDHEVVHGTTSAGTDTIETVRGHATGGGTMTEAIDAGIGHEDANISDEMNALSDGGNMILREKGRDHV